MRNRGLKTLLSSLIVASMVTGSLVVPVSAEEDAFVADEAVAASEASVPEAADVLGLADDELQEIFDDADAEYEADVVSEEADVTGLDESLSQIDAVDDAAVTEDTGLNGDLYSVSDDAIGEDRTFYGFIPDTDLPLHHDVEPSEEMALGAGVNDTEYMSPYWDGVIKDQGFTGNCWAFSTSSALEAGINKKTGKTPSISWKNMSYWNCRKSDLSGVDAADYIKYEYSASTYKSGMHNCINDDSSYLFSGGSGTAAGFLFSQDRCVKDNTGSDDSSTLAVGDSTSSKVTDIAKLYASNTPAAGSAATNYRVPETYLLSGASSNIKNIKAMIVAYGAGTVGYYPGSEVTNNATGAVYNSAPPTGATESYSSHQITVVGWDDDYETSNFLSSNAPSKPGAWICANSWGDDAPRTKNGMTYISYYDDSIVNGGFSFHDVYVKGDPAGAEYFYDNNYGANGAVFHGSYTSDKAIGLAYTAKKAQTLKAISLFTDEDNARFTISVFGNPTVENGGVDLSTNESLSTQSETIKYTGFHTIKLNKPVSMSAGQTIIVSVKPDRETKIPVTYTDNTLSPTAICSTVTGYYAGHSRAHAETSLTCLREVNDGVLNIENKCDNFIRLLTNDGDESGAATFSGNDFDLSDVTVAKDTPTTGTRVLKTLTAGGAKYQITFTGAPVYTGKKHVIAGSTSNKGVTADLNFAVYRNGVKLSENDYKLKLKNNKYPSGYKNKNPQVTIKLGKGADKLEKKELKKLPVDFNISPGTMDNIYELKRYKNLLTGEITKYEFLDVYGNKIKYTYARNGKFNLETMNPATYVPKTRKDVEISMVKYKGAKYAVVIGNGVTVKGYKAFGPIY